MGGGKGSTGAVAGVKRCIGNLHVGTYKSVGECYIVVPPVHMIHGVTSWHLLFHTYDNQRKYLFKGKKGKGRQRDHNRKINGIQNIQDINILVHFSHFGCKPVVVI